MRFSCAGLGGGMVTQPTLGQEARVGRLEVRPLSEPLKIFFPTLQEKL